MRSLEGRQWALALSLLAGLVLIAGCASDDSAEGDAAGGSTPSTAPVGTVPPTH